MQIPLQQNVTDRVSQQTKKEHDNIHYTTLHHYTILHYSDYNYNYNYYDYDYDYIYIYIYVYVAKRTRMLMQVDASLQNVRKPTRKFTQVAKVVYFTHIRFDLRSTCVDLRRVAKR